MENQTNPSFWNKKAADLTVGEQFKFIGGVTAISIVAPMAIILAVGSGSMLVDKLKNRRKKSLSPVVELTKEA